MAAEAEFTVVLSTAGSAADAATIARQLLDRRLAACVNITGPVTSVFRWEGEVREEQECLLVIKTRTSRLKAMREAFLELHPYDCPEMVELPVSGGLPPYLAWLRQETSIAG
ncbi:MAG: divalent-cation tolerance protein CutA [Acidobacteria bacterium]|uniref:Divalent-cation tolerance protein CutA n=1 Tax=Candidatus Polarisedimenticola svalbardensis TaxID=2886004 RepID=A0A8J6XYG4_9BACT|nr:divalent-cation tolerance protein CutA [Candidatus Polarisedimenticola svalbardensis]